jgi:hypothetical protein
VRKTLTLTAGAFVFIVGMAIVMILCLGYYARQAKAERDKVHIGMTVDQVLPLVHGALGIRTHAVLPDNVSDEEGVHYASLAEHGDGTFTCSTGPRLSIGATHRCRSGSADEAEDVGRVRVALAIHLPQRHPTALLLHRDLRARWASQGRHRRLGLGLRPLLRILKCYL